MLICKKEEGGRFLRSRGSQLESSPTLAACICMTFATKVFCMFSVCADKVSTKVFIFLKGWKERRMDGCRMAERREEKMAVENILATKPQIVSFTDKVC